MAKLQLVLDMGGVLITNLTPGMWEELAAGSHVTYAELRERYKQDLKHMLWTGELTLEQFWSWISQQCTAVDTAQMDGLVQKHLLKLPAWEHLEGWSERAELHILSNHRQEWIGPILAPIHELLSSITISSQSGCCKPYPDIYAAAASKLQTSAPVLFVDDQEKNLREAAKLGWMTLLADEAGEWIRRVDALLADEVGE
ncbi:HAD-IA family hydrolase [Paenibacillus hexagrammi]|uniref:HAD-IA family hydrolase n=1 Tax=Paenibacillus hexagrammi TaxID=2908839 RepID=A0ABY3SHD0_9BACL|nr:HAD-IA family hydrolase [Paenibacillus sp. YPD9-1]UJF32900.1 HAD-IA family hydrolase [Paenibacillus sp. YPD9-1]